MEKNEIIQLLEDSKAMIEHLYNALPVHDKQIKQFTTIQAITKIDNALDKLEVTL